MDIKTYLNKHHISFTEFTHPAVFTCEEAEMHCKHIPGIPAKNLFLKERNSKRFFLAIFPAKKVIRIADIEKIVGCKLKFANEQDLQVLLGLTPGSVSPFGLINDVNKKVEVVIDQEIWNTTIVSFHPNVNTATLALEREQFHKFFESLHRSPKII